MLILQEHVPGGLPKANGIIKMKTERESMIRGRIATTSSSSIMRSFSVCLFACLPVWHSYRASIPTHLQFKGISSLSLRRLQVLIDFAAIDKINLGTE